MEPSTPAAAFSAAAPAYDREFGELRAVRVLRRRAMEQILRHVPHGSTILEIGSGTGEDALALTGSGYRVTATDVSPGMVARAGARLEGTNVDLHVMDAASLPSSFRPGSFDAIFSNFGALNCVPGVPDLLPALAGLLRPGGTMILCLLGKYSVWEMAAGLFRLRPRFAFRRVHRGPVLAPVGGTFIPVWYHSIRSIRRASRSCMRVAEITGWSVLCPPPYADRLNRTPSRFAALLEWLDRTWEGVPGLSRLGDHVVLVLRKHEAP